tara:strand:+ start:993 stop:1226 length:234 start_codon:yes stop_codon:yes gene_type:complete
MKKYLFGLGAMLVGAGLMFVLMNGEVSAEGEASKPERFVCSQALVDESYYISHCETKSIDCAVLNKGVSCVKKGIFK